MPVGDKKRYTAKQKRKAAAIEQSYEDQGVPRQEAEARAWATVNKQSGGGERQGGSGTRKSEAAKRRDREDSAQRAAQTRRGVVHSDRPLQGQTKAELLHRARTQKIAGRSSMNKQQLIEALSNAS
ncbi:termination factor Rho [Pseudomonas sp. DTU_2021_1001937_2_SI_NGA_ILE_001]|uniref:termination factor Rho n=1 Tax=Pseudomonas sp. DTU_2021_1001937_2_SI_NGA_ILE_001 TaxID=3077589 RepID=UPI0028FC2292|nr:termination factor Rho [Pseudomonas sp. DTU_2021_1001937_2_SI_NGA_ILE_001]WNW11907.1 termination factor Rho [Pseudomonas sp. DTU_2021_1001937_2_SI_NGA_ILE_001]